MGRCLVMLDGQFGELFCEWSTVVDAPISPPFTESELRNYIKQKEGTDGLKALPARIDRCRKKGDSFIGYPLDIDQYNRAGPKESQLTKAQLYKRMVEERWFESDDAFPQRGCQKANETSNT